MGELIMLFGAELTHMYFLLDDKILTLKNGDEYPYWKIPKAVKTSNIEYGDYIGRVIYGYLKLPPSEYDLVMLADLDVTNKEFAFSDKEKEFDRIKHLLVKLSPKAAESYLPVLKKHDKFVLHEIDSIYQTDVIESGSLKVRNFINSALYTQIYRNKMIQGR